MAWKYWNSAPVPTLETATLDVIAAQHAPAASVGMNSQRLTGLAKGAAATDAANLTQSSVLSPSYARLAGVSGNPRETYPFYAATGNLTPSSGTMTLVLCPVLPGDVITNVGFVSGTTGVTFGSSGYHWWTALYTNALAFVAQSADQTNTALANSTAYMLALSGGGAPYTVPSNTYSVYVAVMVNTGTGGSPVMCTLRGPSMSTAQGEGSGSLFPTGLAYCGTNGTSLGATAPSGTITMTPNGNVCYMGIS
jgi:hypothetical protein